MVGIDILEQVVKTHETDPNYEVDWDSLSELLKTNDPLQDRVTGLIDQLSPNERELIRKSIAYKNAFCPDYKRSRMDWLITATNFKGSELTPDEVIPLANKHRIYFALTHPRGMNIMVHSEEQEEAVYNLIWKVIRTLGPHYCKILGYRFEATED